MHIFTNREGEFIRQHVRGKSNLELTELFNSTFGLALKVEQIKAYKKNHHISSGLTGQFPKGNIPMNKGIKGVIYEGCRATQFKKGQRPHNLQPVGTEIMKGDGYIYIKIGEPNIWKQKHLLLWEEELGPVPVGFRVMFADRNKKNVSMDNLILATEAEVLIMNRMKLITDDKELTKSGLLVAKIVLKAAERKNELKRRKREKWIKTAD